LLESWLQQSGDIIHLMNKLKSNQMSTEVSAEKNKQEAVHVEPEIEIKNETYESLASLQEGNESGNSKD